ncbi:MAG: hypothetical protein ABFS17_04430 [Chloroflexota bacterium]
MKKTRILLTLSIVLIFSMAAAGTVLAEEVTIEGTVGWFDVDAMMMDLNTVDGVVLVYLPEGFDFTGIEFGSELALTGEFTGEGEFTASGVAAPAECDGDGECPDGEGDGDGDGDQVEERHRNAFCDEDKKEGAHPFAAGIAATYGVSEEEVMAMFCDGYSVGAIMLAFQTREMNGADPADTLGQRDEGQGWGQIWKDAGLIDDAEEALPPGQAKKLEAADEEKSNNGQGQDKEKKDNPGNGGNPPGKDKDKPSKDGDD